MGHATQINVVVFDLASRGQYVGEGFIAMSNDFETIRDLRGGQRPVEVAGSLLASLKVLQLRHLPTAGVCEQRTCASPRL